MDTNTDAQALKSQTHPERLVRRGWRGQAGVRSTWPPPLTAPLLKVPIEVSLLLANARIGCFLYGTVPSTAPLFPQDHKYSCCCRCCRKSVRSKRKNNKKNIRVSCAGLFRQMSSLFISRNNGRLFFPVKKHNRWMHHSFIMLMRGPYGIVGFKLSSSDWVQVAQSPVI